MEEDIFKKLENKPPLQLAPSQIYAYGSKTPMTTLGVFHAEVETKTKLSEAIIYVVHGKHGSLLGYQTALQLELIRLNVNALQPVAPRTTIESLAVSHPQLFNGTGKLKSHQVKLHIDQSVKPCIQPYRHVPFHLQKKVEEELNSLLAQDIIEKVDGEETQWLSPLVVVTKPSDPSKVRICVDMRRANKAIMRERFIVPSLDDLIHDLNGCVTFSRLDLAAAFQQLEISPECRYVSRFATFWLFFGINCATEMFQAVMQQVLSGLQGVRCICDDILVYKPNTTETCWPSSIAYWRAVRHRTRTSVCSINRNWSGMVTCSVLKDSVSIHVVLTPSRRWIHLQTQLKWRASWAWLNTTLDSSRTLRRSMNHYVASPSRI